MSELYNPYIVVPLVTYIAAQVIKFVLRGSKGDWNFRLFYTSGGMPSAHSAAVSSLATVALAYEGVASPIFGLAAVFAAIVMYDSFGVRRAAGDQAVVINAILDEMKDRDLEGMELREILGHRRTEVVMGGLLGVASSLIITINVWPGKVGWLVEPAESLEKAVYLGVSVLTLVLAGTLKIFIKKYWQLTKSVKQLQNFLAKSMLGFALVGLLLTLMQYQEIPTGEWRLWWLLLIVAAGLTYGMCFMFWWRHIPMRYHQELSQRKKGN